MEGGGAGEREADPAGFATRNPAGGGPGVLDPLQNRPRLRQECLAGLGQLDAARLSVEELQVELAFQRADLLAKGRLLDAEAFGRPSHMPLLGDRDEIPKVSQIHMLNISE